MLTVDKPEEHIWSGASDREQDHWRNKEINLKIAHSRSLPSTICAKTCRPVPTRSQATLISHQPPLALEEPIERCRDRSAKGRHDWQQQCCSAPWQIA